jgi:hypothetical protein
MPVRITLFLLLPWLATASFSQETGGEMAKVKEQELV